MNEKQKRTGLEIAVIGMAGKFPGTRNIEEFWNNLREGREAITFFEPGELPASGVAPELVDNPRYIRARGILEGKGDFDAPFFGYTPAEAQLMDPQVRIFYECSWAALEDAGYNPENHGGLIGVYAGGSSSFRWEALTMLSPASGAIDSKTASNLASRDFLSTRISYKLNLKGPSVFVNTACSTSLVTIHMACQALLAGECDIALAGGVTVAHQEKGGYICEEGLAYASDGHCRAFDEKSDGTVDGEGAGVVVLKPLDEALEDGDFIYAVVKGTAINNDGTRKVGYMAPSVVGQVEVIRSALHMAEVEPESISYIEAHGTGTVLGDPVEMEALQMAFQTEKKQFCGLGSVKTNIGHLDSAAGAAGFIKTVLALKHKCIPPTIHFTKPNPKIDFDNSPFYVVSGLTQWKNDDYPLRAGVSAFGVGGTNAHVILEEAPGAEKLTAGRRLKLFPLSARTEGALDRGTVQLVEFLTKNPGIGLSDAAYTLQTGRKTFRHRRMLVCSETEDAVREFSEPGFGKSQTVYSVKQNPPVMFLFSAQGSQYVNMGLDLYHTEPGFRRDMDYGFEVLEKLTGLDIKHVLYPNEANRDGKEEVRRLNYTTPLYTSPIKFIFDYALARLIMSWGIKPFAMLGHSLGEYTAACLAGVFSFEDALHLVTVRGKLLHEKVGKGSMMSISISEEQLKPFLSLDVNRDVDLAAVNGPSTCIVAGTDKGIKALKKQLEAKDYDCARLLVMRPGHSKLIEPMSKDFLAFAGKLTYNKPQIPYISGVTGKWIRVEDAVDPHYWVRHLRETVRFGDGLEELLKEKDAVFVQVGSDQSIASLVSGHPRKTDSHAVMTLIRNSRDTVTDDYFLLNKIGLLWLYGKEIDWSAYYSDEKRRRVSLPTYSFDHRRFWIDETAFAGGIKDISGFLSPGNEADMENWFYTPSWKRVKLPHSAAVGEEENGYLVFGDKKGIGSLLAKRLEREHPGLDVVMVNEGPGFDAGENNSYEINPREPGHYDQLVGALGEGGKLPRTIIHCWNISGGHEKDALIPGFYGLSYLGRALGKRYPEEPFRILVVSDRMQDVNGSENIVPLKAALFGPVSALPPEYPNLRFRSVDIAVPVPVSPAAETVIAALEKELPRETADRVIAYRGGHRWVHSFEKFPIPAPLKKSPYLKEKGVYLVMGEQSGKTAPALAAYLSGTLGARPVFAGAEPQPETVDGCFYIPGDRDLETVVSDIETIESSLKNVEPGFVALFSTLASDFGALDDADNADNTDNTDGPAVNAFLDAWAGKTAARTGIFTVNIKWDHPRDGDSPGTGGMSAAQWVEALERVLVEPGISQVTVCTTDLNTLRSRKKILTADSEEITAEEAPRSEVAFQRPGLSTAYAAPGNETERLLAEIWQTFFGIETMGVNDDFFELGGDSLKAMTIISRIHKTFDVKISVPEFFTVPTIGGLAKTFLAAPTDKYAAVEPVEKKEYYPLSAAQKRLYFIYRMDKESTAYVLRQLQKYDIEIHKDKLEATFRALIKRHESLRTSFRIINEVPVQVVHDDIPFNIDYFELSEEKVLETAKQFLRPFDLGRTPLLRVGLIKTGEKRYRLIVDMHHIISDLVSHNVFSDEFMKLYHGKEDALTPLRIQYKDYAQWRHGGEQKDAALKQQEFWLREFEGELPVLNLPTDFKRPEVQRFEGREVDFWWEKELLDGLKAIARREETTLYMLLLALYNVLLAKLSGSEDVIVGTPTAGRPHADLQAIIGMFVNTLALRNVPRGDKTFKDFLKEVKERTLNAFENQDYQFDDLVEKLEIRRDTSRNPLFDVIFAIRNLDLPEDGGAVDVSKLKGEPSAEDNSAIADMLFGYADAGEMLNVNIQYRTGLFKEETIRQFGRYFKQIISNVVKNVDILIEDIEIISEEEQDELLHDYNIPSGSPTVKELFEAEVLKNPGHIALVEPADGEIEERSLTYAQLNERTNRLAWVLREKGVTAGSIVGLMCRRSIEAVTAVLAIIKAGGAFLPIEPGLPEPRKRFMLSDSGVKVLLTQSSLIPENTQLLERIPGSGIIDIDGDTAYDGGVENPPTTNSVEDAAYVLYTSGSTGLPKGVVIRHGNVVNYISWAIKQYVQGEKVSFPLYTTLSFDLTVTSIFTPLLSGNTIVVYGGGTVNELLIEKVMRDNRVDIVKLTPSHLKLILNSWDGKESAGKIDSRVKRFIVGGEALETALAHRVHERMANPPAIYNEYGPTEATVGCMIYRYDPDTDLRKDVPIGLPADNVQIYLLGKNRKPVPKGIPGEMYIAGDGLAEGYLNRPQLTDDRFVDNPFIPDQKMYRTGDQARFLDDGNIEFIGRIDHQVKIRGYRIELGEIESKLKTYRENVPVRVSHHEDAFAESNEIPRCAKCLIPVNFPGARMDEDGVCNTCREHEKFAGEVARYFKTGEDFARLTARAKEEKQGDYDCLLLFSGGKDSTFVLYQLIDMGLKVLTFTFDNGYISDAAFTNIKKTTTSLGVENIVYKTDKMNDAFVESLNFHHDVCHGCWNALNTMGVKVAHQRGISLVLSGLSRGQIFEMRLEGLFERGIYTEEEIEKSLLLFRKSFHSKNNRFSRILDVELSEEVVEQIQFVDFFRYFDTPVKEIREYLHRKGWVQPVDTGFCSSNCIINDVGIYVFQKERGYHFYAAPLSWDVRLGVISREQGLLEMGFEGDLVVVDRVLKEVGYYEPPVKDAVVIDKEDAGGDKHLCAYVVLNEVLTVNQIMEYLSVHLPDYMIPAQFVQIEKIPLTANGKLDRKALLRMGTRLDSGRDYAAPENETEEKLTEIWSGVLDIDKEKISIHDDFFLLGGNSLKATSLASRIHKEFNTEATLAEIFNNATVSKLRRLIGEKTGTSYAAIDIAEDRDEYPLSSAQKRLFFIYHLDEESIIYNMPMSLPLGSGVDREQLEESFLELINRHEMLRASFFMRGEEPFQVIHDTVEFKLDYLETDEKGAKEILGGFIRPFDLREAPALRALMIRVDEGENLLLVDMHHIVTDGISNGILATDILALYNDLELPELRIRYRDYALWQNSERQREIVHGMEAFWLKEFEVPAPVLNLPADFPRPPVQSFEGSTVTFGIDSELTASLNALASAENATLFMMLMAIYTILLAKLSGMEDIVVGTPMAGRRHSDLESVVGIFANTMVLRNYPGGEKTVTQFLAHVKEQILNAFENQEYQFEDLVEKIVEERNAARNPVFDVGFSLQNFMEKRREKPVSGQEETESRYALDYIVSRVDLSLNAVEEENSLQFVFEYCTKLFKKETIQRFAGYFKQIAGSIVTNTDTRLNDIEIITGEEKNQILHQFNDIKAEYPQDKTIHRVFEEKARQKPGQIALSYYLDLSALYETLRDGNIESIPLKDFENACLRQNPYIFRFNDSRFIRSLDILDENDRNRLVMLNTHKLDYAAVNGQTLLLLDYLDGSANLRSVLKGLAGQAREFIICTFDKDEYTDFSLKHRFRFTLERDAVVGDVMELIHVLFAANLIDLTGYTGVDVELPPPPAEDSILPGDVNAAGDTEDTGDTEDGETVYSDNKKAPVLLLGDRVGQASTGLLYIASYLRRNGVEAYCWWNNMSSDQLSLIEGIEKVMAEVRPRVVGVSMKWFPHIARVIEICKTVKACDPTVEVVVGGNTASYYKDDIIKYDCIDYVVKGDGELPFLKICSGEDEIPNCVYKRDGEVLETPISYVQDKKSFGDFHWSHWDRLFVYAKDPFLAPYYYINTGKGCAMQCLYCAGARQTQEKVFHRPKPFLRDVEGVKNDMRLAMNYTSTLWFDFDIPIADTLDYYKQIWEGLDLSGHFCEFYFWKLPSLEFVDEAVRRFKYSYFNIDLCSLSEPHRLKLAAEGLVKPQPTDEELIAFFDHCEQYAGVEVIINQISGLPYFTEDDIERSTVMLNRLHKNYSTLGAVDWGRLHAQPGAPIVENYSKYDMHCYATSFPEFLSYSELNLKETTYPTLESFNYPYIYYKDEALNSKISAFYADTVGQIHSYLRDKGKRKQPTLTVDMTYKELNDHAGRLARGLRGKGVTRESIVGIMMDRSLETITAMLAVLKAGGAYLPVDPGYPKDRIEYMLTDSGTDILLTNKAGAGHIASMGLKKSGNTHLVPHTCQKRAQIQDFDNLPMPDRSLIDVETYDRYIGISCVKGAIAVQATRGCPYKCAYCHKIWPKSHVSRSAENLYTEIKTFYDMGVRRFTFIDDIFNLNRKNSMRFFNMIIENGLDIQLFFSGGLRGDILDEEYIDRMVEAGVVDVALALETASPRLQKLMAKNLDIEKLKKNIEYFAEKHPHVILELFLMHGFPTETEEEAKMTLAYLKELKWVHFPYFNIIRIYPNTDVERIAIANGISKEAIYSSAKLAYHELPETLPFDKSFTKACQAEFLNDYFLDKERLLHVLPHQMNVLSEDELVQKYGSYLPIEIEKFQDFLDFVNITREELGSSACLEDNFYSVPGINAKIKEHFGEQEVDTGALRVLLLDLTQSFSEDWNQLNNLVDMPLGLMYLSSYLNREFGGKVYPKIAKPMIDFDSYDELKEMLETFKPDLIGVRSLTYYKEFFHRGIEKIRRLGYTGPLVAGGPYATSESESILQDTNVDLVVFGEGESTFAELIGYVIENGKKLPGDDVLKTIPGLTFVPGIDGYRTGRTMEVISIDDMREDVYGESAVELPHIDNPGDLAYIIYTSGTTGYPKGVMINHANVLGLAGNPNFIDFAEGDKFLMTGAAVFDISTFEIWASLLNHVNLYLADKDTIMDGEKLETLINSRGIDILHLIPQLFNVTFAQRPELFAALRYFLVGGDMVNPRYVNQLRALYPGLNIRHMYGPTENTTFSTFLAVEKEYPGGLPIGGPVNDCFVYIADKSMHMLPVGVVGEICVGGAGVARGYLNHPELTAEKFSRGATPSPLTPYPSLTSAGTPGPLTPLYKTGDLGRWMPDGNIEFLGRGDHQVKVRGFRIEPGEIENRLTGHPGVKDAVILTRENSAGDKDLCAYIVLRPESAGFNGLSPDDVLRDYLAEALPDYMIPSYFIHLEDIPLTTNGKVDRGALPEPGAGKALSDYEAPGNEVEERLVEIWSDVLGTEVGINDNFFKVGGDSIKTIQVAARLRVYNMELKINELFLHPTIKEAAKIVKTISGDNAQRSDQQGIIRGLVPLTPIQHDLFENFHTHRHHLNQAIMLYKEDGFEKEVVTKVFSKIVEHHDALRMVYKIDGENIKQENRGLTDPLFHLETFDLTAGSKDKSAETTITKEANRIQRGIDLENGPLVKLALFKTTRGDHLLMVVHHLVIDAVSLRTIFEDLGTAYRQAEKGENIVLPPKTDSFKYWASKLNEYAPGKTVSRELKYWRNLEETPVETLPRDYTATEEMKRRKYLESVSLELSEDETRKLVQDVNHAYNTDIEEILLTALGLGIKEYWGIDKTAVAMERHGRDEILENIDINRTVGWFTAKFPVILDMSRSTELSYNIRFIKETMRRVPGKGTGYGILRYLTPETQKDGPVLKREPEITFNYLGQFGGEGGETGSISMSSISPGDGISPELAFNSALDITGAKMGGKMALTFTYNTKEYNRETIKKLAEHCKTNLISVIGHCADKKETETTPADAGCDFLTIDEFDKILRYTRRDAEDQKKINRLYPLSPMQEGMLFHSVMNKARDPYVEQTGFTLVGTIDHHLLEKSFDKLIERYDVLRTVFIHDGLDKPVQVVFNERKPALHFEDISHMDEENRLKYLENFKTLDIKKGFDLSTDTLMRISLLKIGADTYKLVWTLHHILMDGWCLGIVFSDLLRFYLSFKQGGLLELPAAVPYADYIEWLMAQDKEDGIKTWSDYLAGYHRQVELPKSASSDAGGEREAGECKQMIDKVSVSRLEILARDSQVTINTIFQAVWGLLLQKYNNCDDAVFGAVVSGRPPEVSGVENMVGLFINSVPVRVKSEKAQTFTGLLRDMHTKSAALKPFEYIPLADIQADSGVKGLLFDHVLAFESFPVQKKLEEASGNSELGFGIDGMDFVEQTNYDLSITVSPGMLYQVKFNFNRLVYNPEFMNKILEHFLGVINQVIEKPDIPVGEIEISHDFLAVESNVLLEDEDDWELD